jgi:endogenous inhibitor of DNA gyrase (YacG/DUF329 family)
VSKSQPARIVACPACGKASAFTASNHWRPFCSERCRTRDLGAWATESYKIPAAPGEDDAVQPDDPRDQLK